MSALGTIWRHRALVWVLVRRELAARYRSSVLGFFWSLLNPLLLLAVYSVVFTTVFQPRMAGAQPYPLFLFTGLLPWLFFSSSLLEACVVLVDNGPLLAKVVCPPEIFPAVVVTAQLIHHLLAMVVLLLAVILAALFGWHPFPASFPAAALGLGLWVVATGGLALAVAPVAVHLRDLRDLLNNLLNLLFFASPIIYKLDGIPVPWLRNLLSLNPLAYLVEAYRGPAFSGTLPGFKVWGIAVVFSVICWIAGEWVFSRLRDTLVEVV